MFSLLVTCAVCPEGPPPPLKSAVFRTPDVSASAIANSARETYDVFGHVCREETYLPNLRTRMMTEYEPGAEDTQVLADSLSREILHVDTYKKVTRGSETFIVDQNLETILSSVLRQVGGRMLYVAKPTGPNRSVMSTSAKNEHCVVTSSATGSSSIVYGAEVKGLEASIEGCYSQLTTVCGDAAIELRRLGLNVDDYVVPGLAMAGRVCQFCAVYLIAAQFPVLVALSPILYTVGSPAEQYEMAQWHLRAFKHAKDTVDLLQRPHGPQLSKMPSVRLDIAKTFVKPVRALFKADSAAAGDNTISQRKSRLNDIMRMYELIRRSASEEQAALVLFPCGVIGMPDPSVKQSADIYDMLLKTCKEEGFLEEDLKHCPLMLFPLLEGWSGGRHGGPPDTATLASAYLAKLRQAIDLLNLAGVAHMDLRPANIMWRVGREGELELKLIDFEDSVVFGRTVHPELVRSIVYRNDYRYPFRVGDEVGPLFARREHNEFYFKAVSMWAQQESAQDFDSFMDVHGQLIQEEVLPVPIAENI